MANREQHVGIDFKNSTIAINGTTTASRYLGTDASGNLEWKSASSSSGNPMTLAYIDIALDPSTASILTVTLTGQLANGSTFTDSDSQSLINMACPNSCPEGT